MAQLEELTRGAVVRGILPDSLVTVVDVKWHGSTCIELTHKGPTGHLGNELLFRDREASIEVVTTGHPWSFDSDGETFRLVSEAHRIRLAYLFDPLLAVHTALVEPLPHQITAVYGEMLSRQPLRYLLADDPGAGKTIMAGLLIKELLMRGDLERCLICCPGNLAEQWQDEMSTRFHLPFEIVTREKIEASRSGNPYAELNLVISRLDHMSRNDDIQAKLQQTDWDLIICDEAHKMSATFFGREVRYTRRYRLGQLLSQLTRHFLLMTATPHNGKEEDFQLFMALLDGDRFEGRFRDGVHQVDTSDLMRRLVKEHLLKFDGTPLFPERIAYTVNYTLSDQEAALYQRVTDYVREEFNRADALESEGRKGTVGFALTTLQRRLASSPEAIYQSLRRRRERLEKRVREEELLKRGAQASIDPLLELPAITCDEIDEIDDAPDAEVEKIEGEVVDQATAARTIAELRAEIATLGQLEAAALAVRHSGTDRKWEELSNLLQNNAAICEAGGYRHKLIVFTEHRDTLNYLWERISTLLGRPEAVVTIHGRMGREERKKAQEAFTQEKSVQILVATDAAGEGINLQRSHLMVNYDLPWNPNRLEQRFGRVHRIGQTEVCHLWNMVATETREGEVYNRLLQKLEEERLALGGQVFDILGKVTFENRPLRDLLLEAIRYGDQPEVRERLNRAVEKALDRQNLESLLEERALVHDAMDASRVRRIREDMERAEARRLQPHFIAAFFLEACKRLGGSVREREPQRYEVTHVPALIRNRDRLIGTREPVLPRYERITFEKELIAVPRKPLAAFICPGHPLLDATIDLVLERHRDLLRRGAIVADPADPGEDLRALFYLEHAIQDARQDRAGNRRVVSRQMQFVEGRIVGGGGGDLSPGLSPARGEGGAGGRGDLSLVRGEEEAGGRGDPSPGLSPARGEEGAGGRGDLSPGLSPTWGEEEAGGRGDRSPGLSPARVVEYRTAGYAPYLDYRSLSEDERALLQPTLDKLTWALFSPEDEAVSYAVGHIVPQHLADVRRRKEELVTRTMAAVKDRLTKEINYWDHRAEELKLQELAGRTPRLNSGKARQRADDLAARLQRRMAELEQERLLSPQPPVVVGGALIVPAGLLARLKGQAQAEPERFARETTRIERLAMEAVMAAERSLGHEPRDVSADRCGYDVESKVPGSGHLRFIEVKGRAVGADTITVTKNEILTALNKPEQFILAIVQVDGDATGSPCYILRPFHVEPDFGVTSVNYDLQELLAKGDVPR